MIFCCVKLRISIRRRTINKSSFTPVTHVGVELNAMTTGLHFIKWLLGDSKLAAETRKKQIVLLVLITMPDAFIEQRYSSDEKGEGNPTAGYYIMERDIKAGKEP